MDDGSTELLTDDRRSRARVDRLRPPSLASPASLPSLRAAFLVHPFSMERPTLSWIRSIPPGEASGPLAEAYVRARAASSRGHIANLWQAQGLDPSGLAAVHALYRSMMADPGPLSRAQAEMIAVVVSATNGCGYCVSHHGPRLAAALGD